MRKGEQIKGIEFYNLLYTDDEFCKELGKSILAAGRFEAELIKYLDGKNIGENTKKANLGKIILYAKKYELLSRMVPVLETIRDQRNYLTHNIYALFTELIDETILPRSKLLDSDVDIFTDRARQLNENINGLADLVENYK